MINFFILLYWSLISGIFYWLGGQGGTGLTSLTGQIIMYGGTSAPSGWLACNGTAVSRTTYSTLFGIIGTTYGVGDSSTTFNLPNLVSKFARGSATPGTGAGSDTVTITANNLPSHTHAAGTLTGGAHTHQELFQLTTDGELVVAYKDMTRAQGSFTQGPKATTKNQQDHNGEGEYITGSGGAVAVTGATGNNTTTATDLTVVPAYEKVMYIIKY